VSYDLPVAPFFVGTVKSTDDPKGYGRIQVEVMGFSKAAIELPWMRIVQPYASAEDIGMVFLPEVGDEVLVLRGSQDAPHQLVCLGVLYNGKSKPPATLYDSAANTLKGVTTASGHTLLFDDDQEKISLYTKEETVSIVLDGKEKTITITASDKDIIIDAKGDVTVTAGGNANVEATKDATVKAKNITAEASAGMTIKGKTVNVEASNALTVKGKAVTVKGDSVKIN